MSLESTLKTYGQIGADVLRQAVAPLDATGKTRASIRYVVDGENLMFLARGFFKKLETGIKPSTKAEKIPSREMIASLTEYARARGFSNPEKAAWGLAKKLLTEGDKTNAKGGRVVYSDVMKTFTEDLAKALSEDFGKTLAKQEKENFI